MNVLITYTYSNPKSFRHAVLPWPSVTGLQAHRPFGRVSGGLQFLS